ncbi:MAG: histidine phosphatase family protein [Pseudomonadota bacterium]
MDLILWRHADSEELESVPEMASGAATHSWLESADMARGLTPRGLKQASRMAGWLDRQLSEGARVMVSPAVRCEQTAQALGRKYRICPELAPGVTPEQLLSLVQWPSARHPVVLIGHQPGLGQTVASLIGMPGSNVAFRKGALWWLRYRERNQLAQTVVVSVQTPELV